MGEIKLCPENISGFWSKITYGINHGFSKSKVGRFFKLEARKTCFTQEVRAATATFLTMAYIISVNATILADSGVNCSAADCSPMVNQTAGVDLSCVMKPNVGYQNCLERAKKDLVVATILSSMIGCFAMGIFANLPLGLAPGMGGNAYVAYNLVGFHGSGPFSYKTAMAIVLVQGIAFLAIAGLGLRAKLARLIPKSVRLACAAGIGLFIAFVGLQIHQGVGLVGPDPSTLLTVTACSSVNPVTGECLAGKLHSPTFWLGVMGFIITCYGLMNEVKGSMIFGILFITLISWIRNTSVTYFPNTPIGDSNFNYFKKVVDFHKVESTAGSIAFNQFNTSNLWVSLATLLYVEVLATTGTLYTMAEIGGFVDEKGSFEGEYPAFIVDASSTIVGAALGVSPMAVYVESSAGIREGGKTGLTAVIIGFCFLGSLFFTPLLTSVPPWAIGPSLVVVGIMMAKVVKEVNWVDLREAVPAFITMLLMPLTYSIANGIVGGIGVYVALNLYDYVVRGFRWVMEMRRVVVKEQNQVSASENPCVEII